MRKYTQSELRDPKFYQEHRSDIIAAMKEPGKPRIIIDDSGLSPTINTDELNMFEPPQQGKSFTREQIAAMTPDEYQANRAAILAAARGENGAKIVPNKPVERPKPYIHFESEKAFNENGGADEQRLRDQYKKRAESDDAL